MMPWRNRCLRARLHGGFTSADKLLVAQWYITLDPRHHGAVRRGRKSFSALLDEGGKPTDRRLRLYGARLVQAVRRDDVPTAEKAVVDIERRAAFMLVDSIIKHAGARPHLRRMDERRRSRRKEARGS